MAAKTCTVTITGAIGPGKTVTALVIPGVTGINFQVKNNTIDISIDDKHRIFDYDLTATVTYTISGSNATVTISS